MKFWEVEVSNAPPNSYPEMNQYHVGSLRTLSINPEHVSVIEPLWDRDATGAALPVEPPVTMIHFYGSTRTTYYVARDYREVRNEHAGHLREAP